jgi:rRNA maturation endonuclease Nob1
MFKICPSCKDEFVQHVSVCPDCGVPLRTAEEIASSDAAAAAPARARAGDEALGAAVMLRSGAASELRQLGERLAERGVRFAVDTDPPGARIATSTRGAAGREAQLAIYVQAADAQQASEIYREWMLDTVPGAGDVKQVSGAVDACPGCGEPLGASATACASCGLEFPPLEVACPQCGSAVAVEAERCAQCGYRP